MRWLDGLTDSMDVCWSKLCESVKDWEAWHTEVMGSQRVRYNSVTEQQQYEYYIYMCMCVCVCVCVCVYIYIYIYIYMHIFAMLTPFCPLDIVEYSREKSAYLQLQLGCRILVF